MEYCPQNWNNEGVAFCYCLTKRWKFIWLSAKFFISSKCEDRRNQEKLEAKQFSHLFYIPTHNRVFDKRRSLTLQKEYKVLKLLFKLSLCYICWKLFSTEFSIVLNWILFPSFFFQFWNTQNLPFKQVSENNPKCWINTFYFSFYRNNLGEGVLFSRFSLENTSF